MGWLSALAGIGAIAAAPFTAGTSLGWGLPLLIGSAGAQIIGAGMASDASKNAAATQVASVAKAQQLLQTGQTNSLNALNSGYGQAESLYNPYVQMGASAMPSLQRLAGSGYPGYSMPQAGAAPQPGLNTMGQGTATGPSPIYAGSGATPAAQAQGGTVMMRAPNGQTSAVPANLVPHYQQQGATILQ